MSEPETAKATGVVTPIRKITLMANDATEHEVDLDIARKSKVIDDMYETLGWDELDKLKPIPLLGVDGKTLEKVIEWLEYHRDDHETELKAKLDAKGKPKPKEIPPWDNEYLSCDQVLLFEVIKAANYLNIPKLLDTSCLFVANMLKGKNPDEIRKMFNIKNDLPANMEEDFCEKCRVKRRRRRGRGAAKFAQVTVEKKKSGPCFPASDTLLRYAIVSSGIQVRTSVRNDEHNAGVYVGAGKQVPLKKRDI